MTKNLHLDHPEDLILTGNLWVIDALYDEPEHISVKIDGAPAVVWGTDPSNDEFFVGTKSVFNKRKIKICYNEADCDRLYPEAVATILKAMLQYVPRTDGIYQGDFIGFGGSELFQPNTVVYEFPEIVNEKVIIAPHTYYEGETIKDAVAFPLVGDLISTKDCLFVQPFVDKLPAKTKAPSITPDHIGFLDDKEAAEAKVAINAIIRAGKSLDDAALTHILGCPHLANLYQLVIEMKEDLMESLIVYNSPKATLGGMPISCEGYVLTTLDTMFKLVNRPLFAYHNFNSGKFQ